MVKKMRLFSVSSTPEEQQAQQLSRAVLGEVPASFSLPPAKTQQAEQKHLS